MQILPRSSVRAAIHKIGAGIATKLSGVIAHADIDGASGIHAPCTISPDACNSSRVSPG